MSALYNGHNFMVAEPSSTMIILFCYASRYIITVLLHAQQRLQIEVIYIFVVFYFFKMKPNTPSANAAAFQLGRTSSIFEIDQHRRTSKILPSGNSTTSFTYEPSQDERGQRCAAFEASYRMRPRNKFQPQTVKGMLEDVLGEQLAGRQIYVTCYLCHMSKLHITEGVYNILMYAHIPTCVCMFVYTRFFHYGD